MHPVHKEPCDGTVKEKLMESLDKGLHLRHHCLGSNFISQSRQMYDGGYFVLSILPPYYIQRSCRAGLLGGCWWRC